MAALRLGHGKTIGAEAAELDPLLSSCFVSTEDYEAIRNPDDPRCVVVARAGTGKTAIIRRLQESQQDVIRINPQSLSFQFLCKSDMLRALRDSGVHLDAFYQSLWRHVLVIEILKHYLPAESSEKNRVMQALESLRRRDKRNAKIIEEASSYLDSLSQNFWNETTDRVQEIHRELEGSLRTELKLGDPWSQIFPAGGQLGYNRTRSEAFDERITIAQQVVSNTKVALLDRISNHIDSEIIGDRMKRCYIVIDDLDSNWVDESLVYQLTRSLLQEVFHLGSIIRFAKIIVCLRSNILAKVEATSPTRGYQRDKLESQRLSMTWSQKELQDLVERRVNHVLGLTYVGPRSYQSISQIFANASKAENSAWHFLTDHCYSRPRDYVHYINLCVRDTQGRLPLRLSDLRRVEPDFSRWRYAALIEEWQENYPGLGDIAMQLLAEREPTFPISEWSEDDVLGAVAEHEKAHWIQELATILLNSDDGTRAVRRRLAQIFYETGIIGLRLGPDGRVRYVHQDVAWIPDSELQSGEPRATVHPALRSHLRVHVLRRK